MRVVAALEQYAPGCDVDIVSDEAQADLVVLHAWGRHTTLQKKIARLNKQNKPYAIIQYVLRSSMRPDCGYWIDMWLGAKTVWSYYDLYQLCLDDGWGRPRMNFYHAPLGVEPYDFQYRQTPRHYTIFASSQHALSEGVRECAFATKAVGGMMFHLGHELRRGKDIVCETGLSDYELSIRYSQSRYVSGLRRVEGFELPVIEGALCGAKPIVFDRPEMRKWFSEFAIFIPETDREGVIENLTKIFREHADPITPEMKKLIKERFDWGTIIRGFWHKVLL